MRVVYVILFLLSVFPLLSQGKISEDSFLFSSLSQHGEQVLFSKSSKIPLSPASILKVLTTSTALEVLGADYRYKTRIGYKGTISNGVLNGDLVIVSGNDPTLGSEFFDSTAVELVFEDIKSKLLEIGVYSIAGDLQIQHDQCSVTYPPSRLWEDMGNYYGGIPHSFNYRDNTLRISLRSREVGSPVEVLRATPRLNYYNIESKAVAADHNKDSAYVYGIKQYRTWWIEGSIPADKSEFVIKSAMPDPSMIFVNELKHFLRNNGILFVNNILEDSYEHSTFQLLSEVHSPPLSEIIKVTNHKSNNLFADQLLLTLGAHFYGAQSWDNGVLAIREFWKDKIDFETNYKIYDGSGLSPKNLVTAEGMVQLLSWMQTESDNFDPFITSLAIGGESGTLKYVFRNPALKGRIIGKSGSMSSVISYCGYFKQSKDVYIPFCIITNNFLGYSNKEVRKYIEEYLTKEFLK